MGIQIMRLRRIDDIQIWSEIDMHVVPMPEGSDALYIIWPYETAFLASRQACGGWASHPVLQRRRL